MIPIVADEYSDPEKGTGAVKITPAHDFNDFEVGKRHAVCRADQHPDHRGGELYARRTTRISSKGSTSTPERRRPVWDELDGLDRFEARKRIVEHDGGRRLPRQGRAASHTAVPHGDRGGVPIEPFLTDQWYVNAATLAKPAIASVREGRTNFVPKNWEKTYFDWMENIQPWCISRQLWWGHQIPAWYGPDGQVFVEKTEEEALDAADRALSGA